MTDYCNIADTFIRKRSILINYGQPQHKHITCAKQGYSFAAMPL
jgi:hypothetical protein